MTADDAPPRPPGGTRERILDAATSLAAEHGYDAVTMRAVAKRVGVTPMALYRHVEDKEALIAAALARGFEEFTAYLSRGEGVGTPVEELRATVDAFRDFAWDHGASFELMFLTTRLPDGIRDRTTLREQAVPAYVILLRRVQDCLGAGAEAAEVDAEARRMLAAAVGAVALHRTGVFPADREAAEAGYDAVMAPLVDRFAGVQP